MVGTGFMGRAHSNAWDRANCFFDLPRPAVLHTVCGRRRAATKAFGSKWRWNHATDDFQAVLDDPDVGLVDVTTPNDLHPEQAIAALEAGKHVACEKPLAADLDGARAMRDAAKRAKRRGLQTFVWFNYRRCPALAFAHQLVQQGAIGRIYHVRAAYLQDWGGPTTPLVWRFDAARAGSGAHGDLNAHLVDMARFICADEITEINGAIEETFIHERKATGKGSRRTRQRSTVDDCVSFLARFRSGAVASFEATRLATGNQNSNRIEINGERGSIKFDFERMNELQWWDNSLPTAQQGWSRIMCTNAGDHPYVEAYWPPAHLIGYEHGFVSQVADIVTALAGGEPVVPLPDFEDAYQTQRVLEAALVAARERCAVKMREIK
ncbi:MAG: Gfo/Idh/MocA family protein [Planctomycetota bacterium]|jgi:predicted dehydrogenase